MNNNFKLETNTKHYKISIVIIILLTAVISFFTGILFGKNYNMSPNISSTTTKIKNTLLNNKSITSNNFKKKISEKIKKANIIEEEKNRNKFPIKFANNHTAKVQKHEQELLQAKLPNNQIKQEQLQTQKTNTNDSIMANRMKPIERNINNNTIIVNDEKNKTEASVINENIPLTAISVETENQQNNANITQRTDNKNTKNKDTVYVVMVNNNVSNGSKTDNQKNIKKENNFSTSNTKQRPKTAKMETKKQNNIKINKALNKQPVKQNRKQDVSSNKTTTKKTIKTKAQKKKAINAVKQDNPQKTINNNNKKETKGKNTEKEELIIELDDYENTQRLQNIDVETLIVIDNETGEEYEMVPYSTDTDQDNQNR